jgi:multisubunit Na+/H+ antiporter MnhG subunit
MSAHALAVAVLLGSAVGIVLLCSAGVALMGNAYDRLHFVAPVSLAAILIAIAVLVEESPSLIGIKAVLVAIVVLVTSPLLTHATGRALWIREHGEQTIGSRDGIEVEER